MAPLYVKVVFIYTAKGRGQMDKDSQLRQQFDDDLEKTLRAFKEAWAKGSGPAAQLPGSSDCQAKLSGLLDDVLAVQSFALSIAKGDLSQSLKTRGLMAGSLKALQANLRHLTWQTRMVAKGDLSQRVDFMGEFSDSFNSMVSSLAEARDRLRQQKEELARANARLVKEIAERIRAEEELRKLTDNLAHSNADLKQFAYAASHDLQEPLRVIAGFVKLLAKRYKGRLDTEADSFIEYMVDAAKRMQIMIKDLLEYSQVETRGKKLNLTAGSSVVEQAISNLKAAIEESGAIVTYADLPLIKADELQLIRLFQNLIGNAVKFRGSETPRVHVSAAKNEKGWLFSVRDNGIGIDPKFMDRIFAVFQRLHTREEYPGTGIGLAICKKIVERHGGHIWVESEPGMGSTFHFTIPDNNEPSKDLS